MNNILENTLLAPYTTFKIGGTARWFCECENVEELRDALDIAIDNKKPVFVLGDGSNVLVSDNGFDGVVIRPIMKGIEWREDGDYVIAKVAAGENWDEFVAQTVNKGLWGIENLSHIPGSVGAVAVQNVGAYGQEVSSVIQRVEVFSIVDFKYPIPSDIENEVGYFENDECKFSYRKSIFNTINKNDYIILSVVFKLSKLPKPNLEYGDVNKYFIERNLPNPTQAQIRQAIIEIRDKKFPYPTVAVNGNAGSFFRGPVLNIEQLAHIKDVVYKKFGEAAVEKLLAMENKLKVAQGYKTPTAFLMELCGLKGYQIGGAKINEPQPAIVLNATGTATAKDVLYLKNYVINCVKDMFEVELEVEPEFVGL